MVLKKYRVFFFLVILSMDLWAQYDQGSFMSYQFIQEEDHRKLYLSVENQNLFWNNEFFNAIAHGYTTFGTLLNTSFRYHATPDFLIEGGLHMLQFYGENGMSRVRPLFRIHYQPIRPLSILMGTLHGGLHHGYIEPFYQFERFMTAPPETGLQILYQSVHWDSDLYLDWTQYLPPGSTGKNESFTLGWTNEFRLLDPERNVNLSIPVQGLMVHLGGPGDSLNQPVESLFNASVGIHSSWKLRGFFQELGAVAHVAWYRDLSPEKTQTHLRGHAFYPNLYTKGRWFQLVLGYWRGHQFMAPLGNPIFSSVSDKFATLTFPERELLLFKISFDYPIAEGLNMGIRYENYLDLRGTVANEKEPENNYSYGVYITFNRDFLLTEIRKFK